MSSELLQNYSRLSQICKRLNISTSSVWRKVREGSFPKPHKLSAGITAWKNSDLADWEKDPVNYGRGSKQ